MTELRLSQESRRVLGVEQPRPGAGLQFGLWWVQPIFGWSSGGIVGRRMMPGVAASHWPVVRTDGPAAITIASHGALAVARIIFQRMAFRERQWLRVAELLDVEWRELLAVHHSVGGQDNLEAVRKIAADEALMRRCFDPTTRDTVVSEVLRQLDPSFDGVAEQAEAEFVRQQRVGATPDALRAAWNMMLQPCALDASWDDPVMPFTEPSAVVTARFVYRAASLLCANRSSLDRTWTSDPLWSAVEALGGGADQFSYNGSEHMNAARALDESGQPARAFGALISCTFWANMGPGASPPVLQEAARWLAEKSGWSEIVTALDARGPG